MHVFDHEGYAFAFHPAEFFFATGGQDTVKVWDLENVGTTNPLKSINIPVAAPIERLTFSRDGDVVVGLCDSHVEVCRY